MRKEIREVGKNVVQITTADERWYARPSKDSNNGLPKYEFVPSVTWIAENYPKGIGFYKWLADKGWDEALAIRDAAGDKGSKVHHATVDLESNKEIPIDAKYPNPNTGEPEELTIEEIDCLDSFCRWHDRAQPELLASEMTVFGTGYNGMPYAGTLDRIYRIEQGIVLPDLKTSQNIWESHKMQVSAYSHADIDYKSLGITEKEWKKRMLAILQLGYRRNKDRYKFTIIPDKFDLFKTGMMIWHNENPDAKPKQAEYPLILKLGGNNGNRTDGVSKVQKHRPVGQSA